MRPMPSSSSVLHHLGHEEYFHTRVDRLSGGNPSSEKLNIGVIQKSSIWNTCLSLFSCYRETISMGNVKHSVESRVVFRPKKLALSRGRSRSVFQAYPGRLAVKWWGLSSANSHTEVRYLQGYKMIRLVWLLAIAGLIVSGIVFNFFSREHYNHFEDMVMNMCDERARMLQHQFAVSMNHVHSLAILVSTFHVGKQPSTLDQDTFAEYTARTAFERPLMTGVAYAQKVLNAERESFEREQGWKIKTMHSKDLSPVKEEYAPTIFSQETIGYLVSLDMMSGDEDQENILRARATGKGVLTRPFRLLESNHLGVVLTFAVYKKEVPIGASAEERIEATAGYLGGAFDFESLVETLLCQLAKNEAIIVNVYDVTNASNPLVMYGPDPPDRGFSHISSLDFGDPFRKHEMRCRLARKIPYPELALGFTSGVLALVSLICYMVYNAHMHVKKVEEDYRKMEELKVQAEAADIAKSQFLATVSHEIRTPMNGVLGMLKMLMDTELDATQQDFARTAHASGKALITLINEVLDQAKIEAGRIELEAVPFDLRAILDDVLSLFSGKTRDKGFELAVFVSERVPQVLIGDPGRFRQIVTNLVGNSVKFTSKGHIFVCVHLWDDIESGRESFSKERRDAITPNTLSGSAVVNGWSSWETFKCLLRNGVEALDKSSPLLELSDVKLFLSIEDTGVGIPLLAQKRIFMPFMQADSSTSRTYGGTGIGLSISRCLVELMNGEMRFESRENVGTTFTCTLVLKKGREKLLEDSRRGHSDPLPTKFKGMKAMIVDGRPVRVEVAKYHLMRLGLQVKVAYDFKQALQILSGGCDNHCSVGESLDMVLVDKDAWGTCSGLTFPHLLKEARKNASWSLPKMLLMAVSIDVEQSEQAKAMGYVDTVIMKPLRASMIGACLHQVLGMVSKGGRHQGREEASSLQNLLCGKRILVVDDNRVNRRVAAAALKKYGAHVETADSGKVAIEKLKPPLVFDACFMDIQMPEMDGFEATRQIRKNELANEQDECYKTSGNLENGCRHNHVPILAMTADVIQATNEECLRCGMDGYVSKPFEEDVLYRAVVRFFDLAAK